jgi:hypothetical protein
MFKIKVENSNLDFRLLLVLSIHSGHVTGRLVVMWFVMVLVLIVETYR